MLQNQEIFRRLSKTHLDNAACPKPKFLCEDAATCVEEEKVNEIGTS